MNSRWPYSLRLRGIRTSWFCLHLLQPSPPSALSSHTVFLQLKWQCCPPSSSISTSYLVLCFGGNWQTCLKRLVLITVQGTELWFHRRSKCSWRLAIMIGRERVSVLSRKSWWFRMAGTWSRGSCLENVPNLIPKSGKQAESYPTQSVSYIPFLSGWPVERAVRSGI